jgi:hypothetical protein
MLEDTQTYRLARFSTSAEAEGAHRCLADAGIECRIVPEAGPDNDFDAAFGAVHLVCRLEDRIQAIVTLERARVI